MKDIFIIYYKFIILEIVDIFSINRLVYRIRVKRL